MKWNVTADLEDAIENATEAETLALYNLLSTRGGDLAKELAWWLEEIAFDKGTESLTASVERLRTGS